MNEFQHGVIQQHSSKEQSESNDVDIHTKAVELVSRREKGFEKLLDALERIAYSENEEPGDGVGVEGGGRQDSRSSEHP